LIEVYRRMFAHVRSLLRYIHPTTPWMHTLATSLCSQHGDLEHLSPFPIR
jgi:hypothetical protein